MFLAETVGIEPTHLLSQVYGLAIRCITSLPNLHVLVEAVRFELTDPFLNRRFSRPVQSTMLCHVSINLLVGAVRIELTHLISKTSICSNRFNPNKTI